MELSFLFVLITSNFIFFKRLKGIFLICFHNLYILKLLDLIVHEKKRNSGIIEVCLLSMSVLLSILVISPIKIIEFGKYLLIFLKNLIILFLL